MREKGHSMASILTPGRKAGMLAGALLLAGCCTLMGFAASKAPAPERETSGSPSTSAIESSSPASTPRGGCPTGEMMDCNGNCFPSTWLGDGLCDDGTYDHNGVPIFLDCNVLNCDNGDCDPASCAGSNDCGSCTAGGADESEPCATQINGGCDDGTYSYTTAVCGTGICGRSWADAGQADIDWYEVFLPDDNGDSEDKLKITVESQLPLIIEVFDGCFSTPLAVADSDGCDAGEIELCLEAPKVYYVRVLPGKLSSGPITSGYPCSVGYEYTLNVSCETECDATSCPTCVPAPDGLLAWWAMDDAATATSVYELIHENNAAPSGLVELESSGVVEAGIKFNSGQLEAADKDRLDFKGGDDFSVVNWIRLTADPVGLNPIIDKRTPESETKLGWTFTTYNGRLVLIMNDADGASDIWMTAAELGDGEWHHVAVTVDRDQASGIRFYIDGTLVDTFDATTVPGDLSTESDIRIGRSKRLDGLPTEAVLSGFLDELQVYHRSLTGQEIQGMAAAGCGGVCKVRMHVPRITPYCEGQTQSDAFVTISNATNQDRWFDLFYDGLNSDPNGGGYCVQDGPTTFSSSQQNPIYVPAGTTVEVPVTIDRPSGLQTLGDSACWIATLQETSSSFELIRKGTVTVNEHICVEAESDSILQMSVGIPTPVKFTLVNQTSTELAYFYRIACVKSVGGQLNELVRLNGEEPGDEVFDYAIVPANGSVDVIVDVLFLRQRGKSERAGYSDVVIYREPGTDVPWYGGDSQGVEASESPVETCGADINCDGTVDVSDLLAVIAAWGDCPEDADCPEDTNGDGVVDVTDLLAVIAGWG